MNLVLSGYFFFSVVSYSLGAPVQDTGGYSVMTLEHFKILTQIAIFWKVAADNKNDIG